VKIERNERSSMSRPPEAGFTGDVGIGGYFKRESPSRLAGATVHFEPGARTPWKINPMGQTLVILSGTGWVQAEGRPVEEVYAGDVIWCPPGERHWEAATPDTAMRYFACQEEHSGQMVLFGDAVSDEEYAAPHR
jgi:quercetin dioxygenase-like cupin family protein